MKKLIFSLTLFSIIFCSRHAEAISRFEEFILGNPKLFRILTIIVFACMIIFIILYNLLSGRKEIEDYLGEVSESKKRDRKIQKEYAEKYREYKNMPTGPIDKISLPPAKLTWLGSEQESYDLISSRELIIGRSVENLVIVERPSTSRLHAKIRPQKEGYVIYDLLSKAGTFVNAEKVKSHILNDGDVIGIGKENFLFKFQ